MVWTDKILSYVLKKERNIRNKFTYFIPNG